MTLGRTIISEEVFYELGKTALAKVENVVLPDQKSSLGTIARIVTDRLTPTIIIKKTDAVEASEGKDAIEATISFELKISVLYGQNIPDTLKKVRLAVKEEVENITGYAVDKIDVTVDKLVKPDTQEEQSPQESMEE